MKVAVCLGHDDVVEVVKKATVRAASDDEIWSSEVARPTIALATGTMKQLSDGFGAGTGILSMWCAMSAYRTLFLRSLMSLLLAPDRPHGLNSLCCLGCSGHSDILQRMHPVVRNHHWLQMALQFQALVRQVYRPRPLRRAMARRLRVCERIDVLELLLSRLAASTHPGQRQHDVRPALQLDQRPSSAVGIRRYCQRCPPTSLPLDGHHAEPEQRPRAGLHRGQRSD